MRAAITLAAALAVATIPASGSAQLMGAKELTAQGLVNGAPSSRSAADLYYLAGDVGARENYTLTIKGPARISLFTPDGHEMLSTSGSGKVVLDAVLNFTDVFVLAVSRVDPRQAYTLSRRTTVPTFAEAMIASYAGYERSIADTSTVRCWLKPGVKLRDTTPSYVRTITLAADRTTLLGHDDKESGSDEFEQTFRLESFQYHMLVKMSDGATGQYSRPYPERGYAFHTGARPRFVGYLCS